MAPVSSAHPERQFFEQEGLLTVVPIIGKLLAGPQFFRQQPEFLPAR